MTIAKFLHVVVAVLSLAVFDLRPLWGETTNRINSAAGESSFSFIAAGDMRKYVTGAPAGKRYFDGVCEALCSVGKGAFMMSPGDVDPPGPVRATIDRLLGPEYLWYPLVGNHETEDPETMAWLRQWGERGVPHLVRKGPAGAETTTFSFAMGDSHFIILNQYYDGKADAIKKTELPTKLMDWLKADLQANQRPLVWVFGHKPLKVFPDMDTGRVRHAGESVATDAKALEDLVGLLKRGRVKAYVCGHTHNASVERVHGLWQVDSGHARGAGDKGAPSTFVKFRVVGLDAWADVYRADPNGRNYKLRKSVELN